MTRTYNNFIYFYHLDRYCILPDCPESIADTMSSKFSDTNALARTAPVYTYNNSGPRQVTINLSLHRDMMNNVNVNASNLKDTVVDFSGDDYVDTLIKYLQAANLPRYEEYSSGSKTVTPPMVAVRFGNDIFIKGVVNGAVTVTYAKPVLVDGKYAKIDISFPVFEVDPYDADIVVAEGSFRGITKTFKDGIYQDTTGSPSYNVQETITGNTQEKTTSIKKDNIELQQKKKGYTLINTGTGS